MALELGVAVTVLGLLTLLSVLQFKYKILEIVAGIFWIWASLSIFYQVDFGFMLLGLIPGLYFLIKGVINNIPEIELSL